MTAEQKARDMLERMGVEGAQSFSAGELVELASLIADHEHAKRRLRKAEKEQLGREQDRRTGKKDRRWPENTGAWVRIDRRLTCIARRSEDVLYQRLAPNKIKSGEE